jgi:serine/threonine protein kinase
MSRSDDLESLLAEVVAHHERHGTLPVLDEYARRRPDLAADLQAAVRRYVALSASLDTGSISATTTSTPSGRGAATSSTATSLPVIDGFRTIERLGAGGMGEVYKLQDVTLDRIVAAKIIRRDGRGNRATAAQDFLREAKSLALFSDPRIVRIFECRLDEEPAVIVMEYVEGFELGRLGPSLEFRQRASVMREIADAVHHAHELGIQHRDLKPSNIMLDGALRPRILDFGLSDGDPSRGHLRGTVAYIAPEQLDPAQPIDARTDVYALGVILYELLCGAPPYRGETQDVLEAVKNGQPRLPAEVDPRVPEALQAIALKAMERRPADRYASARDMARDLDRWLDGRVVLARPSRYTTSLAERVKPHANQIAEWERLHLIYPHEAQRLTSAYRSLEAREDDWIFSSRALTPALITLYLGAFLLLAGSFLYFLADRVEDAVGGGLWTPLAVLGLPFAGLNVAGHVLYRRQHQMVGVAFHLGALGLLPLFLLIAFNETGWWTAGEDTTGQFFTDGWLSNRQLQVTSGVSWMWAAWLALRTRTSALSTAATIFLTLFALGVLTDFGLRRVIEEAAYDSLALRLAPSH